MRIGLFTDAFAEQPLDGVLDWLSAELPAVRDVEIGTGGYSPAPHFDVHAAFAATIESRGFALAALNVSGNPLEDAEHDRALRATIALAERLEVGRVDCMSGGRAELSGGAWFPGVEDATERYCEERVLPYWREIAASTPPRVRLCFELEPGQAAFNVSTVERLLALSPSFAVNLDPSHFFWQDIDATAAIARLAGRIGYAHAKDTVLDDERVALDGLLDRTAWRYATVGHGRGPAWWRALAQELQRAGYDDVISIEYEDAALPADESVREAATLLSDALAREAVA